MSSLNEIRTKFLEYFGKNGHAVVPSSPLVPRNDPTLMFVNSGMVQFKNVFTGLEHRDYSTATTSQKCVRAGGKHNDLDNVGYTARHHTFFEMLGNFSFGNYFKENAISLAWTLLTKEFGLPKERLLVTVYHDDEEAAALWRSVAGLPDDRIIRIATSDNFWSMGPTGPCGPCSEIFYDHGPEIPGGPPGSPDEDGDRFIEIWNLVFMQYDQQENGERLPLPRPSIDTGMGLERIGAVLQGVHDNYDTDLFRSLIEASASQTDGSPYGPGRLHHRVIADHLRSTSFLIADGVLPSNEGRGYVLRRVMRRAMRHAHLLGAEDPVMYRMVPALVSQMGQAFPELARAQTLVEETLQSEEVRFKAMLRRGLRLLEDEIRDLPAGASMPGETAFRLYDTFGFPLDLTQDALREHDLAVDTAGFDIAMAEQKRMARTAWSGSGEAADEAIWFDLADRYGSTEFVGYDAEKAEGQILALVQGGILKDRAGAGADVQVVLNQTPFYAESGGQVGDTGTLQAAGAKVSIRDVQRRAGLFIHMAHVDEGELVLQSSAVLSVDPMRRSAIRANHSATHLLHEALRQTLGDHVAQRGSLVAPDRLRFDFAHNAPLTLEQISGIEADVNAFIRQNSRVETRIMTPDSAQELGARALFGEKYGDEVRVVSMGRRSGSGLGHNGDTYSLELCGGTHVARTGEIGLFKLISESASSSGVRRIEALTGDDAIRQVAENESALTEAAALIKARPSELAERIRTLLSERRSQSNELTELRRKLALAEGAGTTGSAAEVIGGVPLVAQALEGVTGKDLRGLIDDHKQRLGSGVVVLVADTGGRAAVAAGVTDDLVVKVSAVDLVQAAASALGGKGGGGRPDMAQAGGPDPSKAQEALAAARAALAEALA